MLTRNVLGESPDSRSDTRVGCARDCPPYGEEFLKHLVKCLKCNVTLRRGLCTFASQDSCYCGFYHFACKMLEFSEVGSVSWPKQRRFLCCIDLIY